ncbi:MAG: hypothetical protein LWW97_07905 [Deltaproteobacteria bacterium]|jgi:hypothetical protein|nr:hypothetical protein [Deltaproteobacteria bacterium]
MVRSLDVQQIILQSNATERIQQVQQRHPDVQQQYFGDQLDKEKILLREKIKNLEESERLRIKEKEEKEESQRKKKKNPKGGKQKTEKEDSSDVSNDLSADEIGGKVDIKV